MNLNITDPAFLFPGISLLFLAYTNRYMALASIVRKLNSNFTEQHGDDDDVLDSDDESVGKLCGRTNFVV